MRQRVGGLAPLWQPLPIEKGSLFILTEVPDPQGALGRGSWGWTSPSLCYLLKDEQDVILGRSKSSFILQSLGFGGDILYPEVCWWSVFLRKPPNIRTPVLRGTSFITQGINDCSPHKPRKQHLPYHLLMKPVSGPAWSLPNRQSPRLIHESPHLLTCQEPHLGTMTTAQKHEASQSGWRRFPRPRWARPTKSGHPVQPAAGFSEYSRWR